MLHKVSQRVDDIKYGKPTKVMHVKDEIQFSFEKLRVIQGLDDF